MENFILILLIIDLVMFMLGIAMVIVTGRFVVRKEHPFLSIIFAVLQCPCIYIPLKFTIGFFVARIALVVTVIYAAVMIILSLKNMKME